MFSVVDFFSSYFVLIQVLSGKLEVRLSRQHFTLDADFV